MAETNQNYIGININTFEASDISTLVEYQQVMAFETENKTLAAEIVTEALEHMIDNRSYGEYFLAKTTESDESVGCTMINYAFDVLNQRLNIWYQSVYVMKPYRMQKIFTRLFRHVEHFASELKTHHLYLYVEKENVSAQAIYEKLGMTKSTKVFVEKDFYFYHKAEVLEDSHIYQFDYQTISRTTNNPISIDELFLRIKDGNTEGLEFHTDNTSFCWSKQSLCIKVFKNGELCALFIGFVEISDWRNGLNVYINDYYTNLHMDDFLRLIKELEASITGHNPLGMRTTAIRFVVDHDDARKKDLECAGYHLEHFFTYEKLAKQNN